MRKKRTRPIAAKPTYAFVVEGECEFWYLQMLKRNERTLDINIEPRIPQKKKLSDQCETVKNLSAEYKHVYWIVDFDVVLQETRKTRKGEKTATEHFKDYIIALDQLPNVTIIVNNPCFEFWLLLHFDFMKKYIQECKNVQKILCQKLIGYEKTQNFYTKHNRDIYLLLKPQLTTAIANAQKGGGFQIANPYVGISEMNLFFGDQSFNGHFTGKK